MFFDPKDYLERDPATAQSQVEAARLVREAGQRARLCEAMARVAAEHGFEATSAHQVFGAAKLGSSTFYKLFESRDACLLEAFEKCGEVILWRIAEAMAGAAEAAGRAEAGLRALVEILAAEPNVARLMLVEIRVGGLACREAHQQALERFAQLLEENSGGGNRATAASEAARMKVAMLSASLARETAAGRAAELPAMLPELTFVGLALGPGSVAAGEGAQQSTTAQ